LTCSGASKAGRSRSNSVISVAVGVGSVVSIGALPLG